LLVGDTDGLTAYTSETYGVFDPAPSPARSELAESSGSALVAAGAARGFGVIWQQEGLVAALRFEKGAWSEPTFLTDNGKLFSITAHPDDSFSFVYSAENFRVVRYDP
jgi:hypothetical protein